MMWSWGHFYFTYNEKAIDPPRRVQADVRDVAPAGEGDGLRRSRLQNDATASSPPITSTGTSRKMARRRHGLFQASTAISRSMSARPTRALPHKDGKFPTPSGKVEFLLQGRQELRRRPVPHDVRGRSVGRGGRSAAGLRAARARAPRDQSRARQALSAQRHLAEEPRLFEFLLRQRAAQDQRPGRAVRADLARRTRRSARIREGDPVRVFNDRGDFEGVAGSPTTCSAGMVVATLGYWRSLNRSDGSVNSISSAAHCGLGRAPTFSDNLVQVVRVN